MRLVTVIVLALMLITAQPSHALTARSNMLVEKVTPNEASGIYKYVLLSPDCTGGWDNYVVSSKDQYKPGDWVMVIIDICNTEDGLQIDGVNIIRIIY